jgi:hypothetical protein
MSGGRPKDLPDYTAAETKAALLAAGVSGTIYSLVMPESEAALLALTSDRQALLERYREPWTQKQDAMHETYFDAWLGWSAPVVNFDSSQFAFRYPTAGASEGIFKLMAEYLARAARSGLEPAIHIFEGEYEGFAAYAEALGMRCVRHDRASWEESAQRVDRGAMFWISQPSAIDGRVWQHFDDFVRLLAAQRPDVALIPDLTYVGSVARHFTVSLDSPNIEAFVFSHSKPFGGYYHRVGGVFSRAGVPSLFGNKWFKNLLSLAWGTEMMRRHDVFDLPTKYRSVQEQAAVLAGDALGVALEATDVLLIGTAPPDQARDDLLSTLLRGSPSERVIRLCLTAAMTALIAPEMAPKTAPALQALWSRKGARR